jgi:hypothetical protein
MSLSLFEDDNLKRVEETPIVSHSDPGAFDGFFRGTGQTAMKGFAEGGRAFSMAMASVPVLYDAVNGGTEASDRYFKAHDELFGDAVDYWTPKPGEVGLAGQVAGTLLSTLPMVIASPALTVAKTQLTTGEDLTRAGVDTTKAQEVGAVQGLGFGLGVWLPILGKNLVQRVLVGGAAANVVQGAVTRGVSGEILEGTKAEGQFKAFDGEQITLDVLLGLAFGTLAHVSPAQRAQGSEAWKNIEAWGKNLKPSDVEALAVLRQAQHLNSDSLGGNPVDVADIDAHVTRARKAIDQMSRDEPVNVDDLPAARIDADPVRDAENMARLRDLITESDLVRQEEGIPKQIAYHGSPHKFDKFSMDKIGTGEGAQAYGYGLYFAESPGVAKSYAVGRQNGKTFTPGGDGPFGGVEMLDINPPSLYKVDISDSAVKNFLDWDKPLSEQPEVVRNALIAAAKKKHPRLAEYWQKTAGMGEDESAKVAKSMNLNVFDIIDAGGAAFEAILGRGPEASQYLKSKGIPGIRYLDQASRGTGKGTSNFVVFDDSIVKILDVNGKPVSPEEQVKTVDNMRKEQERLSETKDDTSVDPLTDAARQFVNENPDLKINVGNDADGMPITKSAKQMLDEADATMKKATEDANLFKIAAGCIMGLA